jgi:hypothetical protein
MPIENFKLYSTPEVTLRAWARQLNYMFQHIDNANFVIGIDDIKDYMIDFGTGTQQVDALDVPVVDSSGYYTSTSVEGALEEVGRAVLHISAGSSAATLPNYGLTTLQSTAGTGTVSVTLAAPSPGVPKKLYCTVASTDDQIEVYSGSTACFFGPGNDLRIRLYEAGQMVSLIGLSTSRWAVEGVGSIITAALPIFST